MNQVEKPSAIFLFMICLGSAMMSAGSLLMAFTDGPLWYMGITLGIAGILTVFPLLKDWQRVKTSTTMDHRKKQFWKLTMVITFASILCPFVLHWRDPVQDIRLLVGIGAICWAVSMAISYHLVFRKLR